MRVVLNSDEMEAADAIARQRQKENEARGLPDSTRGTVADEPLLGHIKGARGEQAFAVFMGFEHTKGEYDPAKGADPDFPGRWEVKTTPYPNGHLLLMKRYNRDWRYVLVTGEHNQYEIRGWMPGYEAMQEKYWSTGLPVKGVYLIPQADLHSFDEVKE